MSTNFHESVENLKGLQSSLLSSEAVIGKPWLKAELESIFATENRVDIDGLTFSPGSGEFAGSVHAGSETLPDNGYFQPREMGMIVEQRLVSLLVSNGIKPSDLNQGEEESILHFMGVFREESAVRAQVMSVLDPEERQFVELVEESAGQFLKPRGFSYFSSARDESPASSFRATLGKHQGLSITTGEQKGYSLHPGHEYAREHGLPLNIQTFAKIEGLREAYLDLLQRNSPHKEEAAAFIAGKRDELPMPSAESCKPLEMTLATARLLREALK